MPTNYEQIRGENIEEYGKGTRHLEFLGRLYSDRTHFIYELLQNAEDARASKVSFVLESTRLVFKHDGKELFNEKHIRGVCGVAEGTKAHDETKIGRFGIGFKSIYAYTRTPEVHCGDEHFRIEHFVRPWEAEPITVPPPWSTLFVFPFAQESGVTPKDAFDAIGERLMTLGVQTLLFLRNLREITWEISDGAKGVYGSHSDLSPKYRRVALRRCRENPGEPKALQIEEDWILFERPFPHPESLEPLRVEAAFRLEQDDKSKREYIQRLGDAPLAVYFPTAIQTGLGFLIQGPYRTTPARDNIEENHPLNALLIRETGELIVEALSTIKSLGLLTLEVISALPLKTSIDTDPTSVLRRPTQGPSREEKLFGPISARVARALKEEDLLPAHPSGYISGNRAVLAKSSDLRDLLTPAHLQILLGSTVARQWLAEGITADRTPQIRSYLVQTIGVTDFGADNFAQKLSDDFLKPQSDEWFIQFYTFLTGQKALWRAAQGNYVQAGPLRCDKKIIRLQDDSLVAPFRRDDHPNAFLPPEGETEFPIAKTAIVANPKAKEFLVALGLTLPDLVDEMIAKVLVKYDKVDATIPHEENLYDVGRIADAAKTDSKAKRDRLLEALRRTRFLMCRNAETGVIILQAPANIHFQNEDTRTYFAGNPNAHFLVEEYDELLFDLLIELGVAQSIRCYPRKPVKNGHVVIIDDNCKHERGLNGFDPDFTIEELQFALSHPTLERSKLVWNALLLPHIAKIKGEVEESKRKDFATSKKNPKFSIAGRIACESAWLPDRVGEWHKPEGISCTDLPDGFQSSESLCRQLAMEFVSVGQLAEKTGVPLEAIEALKTMKSSDPKAFEEFIARFGGGDNNAGKPRFPERTVGDRDRRDQKIRERTSDSPDKTYDSKDSSTRTSKPDLNPKIWLVSQYTNEEGQMICQMCESEMPFKKRDDSYYFESVEAFDGILIERHELFLAFCPVCAAMYQEFVKRDKDNSATFQAALLNCKDAVVPVQIGPKKKTLRFVETHISDLRIYLTLGTSQ